MKKILTMMALTVFSVFMVVGAANAAYFSPSLSQLLAMGLAWDNGGLGDLDGGYPTLNDTADAALFVGDIYDGTPQFRSIGLGYAWPPPAELQDLSGYDGYALTFTNVNNQSWYVNLYMNTGWTDSPYNETDNFYQNGWYELAVGESVTLYIDFDALGVENQNHVTNIGFQIAFNGGEIEGTEPVLYQGDKYHMEVSTVPIPGAVWLLGSGLAGLVGLRRKYQA